MLVSNKSICLSLSTNRIHTKQNLTALFFIGQQHKLQQALKVIENNPEGQIMVKLLITAKSDSNEHIKIRWTTRSANSNPKLENTNSAPPPDTHPPKRQDSSLPCDNGVVNKRECGGSGADDGDEDACAVCLARAPDCELQPCGHARCCRRCVIETVCTWRQEGPPRCALCRAPFHTMVFLE